jgi:hypothetical protein
MIWLGLFYFSLFDRKIEQFGERPPAMPGVI